jgi:hypothetical protein
MRRNFLDTCHAQLDFYERKCVIFYDQFNTDANLIFNQPTTQANDSSILYKGFDSFIVDKYFC